MTTAGPEPKKLDWSPDVRSQGWTRLVRRASRPPVLTRIGHGAEPSLLPNLHGETDTFRQVGG